MSDPSTRLCPLLNLIPASEVARVCDMSMRSLRRAITAGQLPPPIRIRRRLFFRAGDLKRWLDGQTSQVFQEAPLEAATAPRTSGQEA